MSIDYEKIKRLITLVEENKLTELAVEDEGFSVTIRAESPQTTITVPAQPSGPAEAAPVEALIEIEEEEVAAEPEPAGNLVEIISPMIGVFYRKPAPDAPQFINVGDEIEVGQTVGLIEAMKVFSEVPSEIAGRVVSMPIDNGKLVQAGDVLVVVDVSQA
jgi:acetyl-CoA carboxylase biotin carboxyl carrier protein